MFNIERWQEIFETLRKNKLRTFLTGISVASGIFILVILLGFNSGITNGVRSQFERDATNKISVRTGTTSKGYKGLNPGRNIQLYNEDYSNLNDKYAAYIEHKTAVTTIWGGQVTYQNQSGNYRVEGANPDMQFIENASLLNGRFINAADIHESRKVAVIGHKVQQDIFKNENPIGKNIAIYGIKFKVVGVYSDPGGERENAKVFIPITTFQMTFNGGNRVRSIVYTFNMDEDLDVAVAASTAFSSLLEKDIKNKYSVAPDDRSAVRVYNTLEESKKIYSLINTIRAVFWFVGLGTIVAGVVGVGNIMIIVVKERTKEIGIRKALGATPNAIIMMILQEAVFITTLSGLIGLITGMGLLEIVSPLVDSDFIKFPNVDFNTAIITLSILIIAGVLSGFIPAYRAAKVLPIEALRNG